MSYNATNGYMLEMARVETRKDDAKKLKAQCAYSKGRVTHIIEYHGERYMVVVNWHIHCIGAQSLSHQLPTEQQK
jgi:hypothetical protein